MRRFFSLIIALVLALMLLPAQAEAQSPDALYRIVLRTETGDETLGTGVLFGSNTSLLTVKGCWAEGDLYAIGVDGEHEVSYRGEIAGSQLILLGLAEESAAEPLQITKSEYLLDYKLYGAAAAGQFTAQDVSLSRATVLDGRGEVLLTAEEGLLPGAVMLGEDGGIACLTVSQHGEGLGVYTAMVDATLTELLGNGEIPDAPHLLRGFFVDVKDGQLVIDWTAACGSVTEETVFNVYTSIVTNTYLSYDKVTGGETTSIFPAVPGTQVMVWIVRSEGELSENIFPESYSDAAFVTIPEAKPYTEYGFRNLRCGVTPGEPGKEGTAADFLPQQPLTRESLSDRDAPIYFQTEDTYTVTEEDDDHTLLVALYTPEGYVFSYHSGYVFMPEMNGSDLWMSDISEIFAAYEQFAEGELWPAGAYEIVYYIDGCEAARIPFSLD